MSRAVDTSEGKGQEKPGKTSLLSNVHKVKLQYVA